MESDNFFRRIVFYSLWTLQFILLTNSVQAQWLCDTQYKFKITIPTGWKQSSHMDGSDKVYDFYSAKENAAVQIRVFKIDPRVTTDLMITTYETNMLPEGTRRTSFKNHTTQNGIPGKIGIYTFNHNQNMVAMMTFYTVHNGIGYVLSGMVPENLTENEQEEANELKEMIRSFYIDNSLSGSAPVNTKTVHSINEIAGTYQLVSRSDGNNSLAYWYITLYRNKTFVDRHQLRTNSAYTTGEEGTWEIAGNTVRLINKNNRNYIRMYEITAQNELTGRSGTTTFVFRK
ncbi:lipocalin family protein [Candidatus Sulfidibacterium hydrothermale]|uniref:lipocalin family protein n=1 Tax=Candidatus Sulfidibacterium hydrothermale TaxID=2875962 RepID=UPI001F0A965A|nr:lipocalin family protein [Candidatus Sulfidibacterium hydrothermale]UBM62491.1 lipocalin family protein [Candidatus Sulfidibacterium hydrothermale]